MHEVRELAIEACAPKLKTSRRFGVIRDALWRGIGDTVVELTPRGQLLPETVPTAGLIRVAIVDDHPLLCDGIRRALDMHDDIMVVGEAHTADAALEMLGRLQPDVALLDYRLPDRDGVSVLRDLRAAQITTRVIVLTCYTEEHHVRAAIDSGAVGFLSKSSVDTDTLVNAVRSACEGVGSVSPDVLDSLISVVRHDAGQFQGHLTERESEIWRLVSTGMTNAEIASSLCLSERTVKFHVGNLLRKLDVRSRSEATALAYQSGFMNQ